MPVALVLRVSRKSDSHSLRRQNAEQLPPEIQALFNRFLWPPSLLNLLPEFQDNDVRDRSSLTSLKEDAVKQEITEKIRRIFVWLSLNYPAQPPQGKT